jgi:UDP-glucose 4-epimerase
VRTVAFPADRKAIDIGDYYADYGAIQGALGWSPRVGLREGLARTIEFYRRHGARYWP